VVLEKSIRGLNDNVTKYLSRFDALFGVVLSLIKMSRPLGVALNRVPKYYHRKRQLSTTVEQDWV
jgi:hypothetical protein